MDNLAFDIETTLCSRKLLRVITVADKDGARIIYRYDKHGESVPNTVWEELEGKRLIGHNLWFDLGVLSRYGFTATACWDTMLSEMAIATNSVQIGLDKLLNKYFGLEIDKTLQCSDWGQALTDEQVKYCMNDVTYLLEVYEKQREYLEYTGAITHCELKNNLIKVWSGDLDKGYPLNMDLLKNIQKQCIKEYTECIDQLLEHIHPSLFIKANYTVKGFKEKLIPYYPDIDKIGRKKSELIALLETGSLDEPLIKYIHNYPLDTTITILASSSQFCKAFCQSLNINRKSYNQKAIEQILEEYTGDEVINKCLNLIIKSRALVKIYGTYSQLPEDQLLRSGDETRLKLKHSYTNSGRIGLTPLSTMPKEKDISELYGVLRDLYIAPKGYKSISTDLTSIEDIVSGVMYNDPAKMDIVTKGYDQYLLFASKLFGTFEYTDPSQTAELKEKYGNFRQAVKSISLSRNYGSGAKKLDAMIGPALNSVGLDVSISGSDIIKSWKSLYTGIAAAQDGINNRTASLIKGAYNKFDFDKEAYGQLNRFNFDKYAPENEFKAEVLKDSRLILRVSSVLGLCRDFAAYREFCTTTINAKSVKTTEVGNFPIQTTAGEIIWLAVIMVKKLFPSLVIPVTIHDSIVVFCPEGGINGMSVENVQESIHKILEVASFILLGFPAKSDSKIDVKGF